MKALRVLFVTAAAAVAMPVLSGGAQAQVGVPAGTSAAQCVRSCAQAKRECVQTARVTALACKQQCRDTSPRTELGTCMRGCATAFRDAKDLCRDTQKTCKADCRSSMSSVAPVLGAGCRDRAAPSGRYAFRS